MNVLHAVRRNRLTSDSYIGESALRQVFQGGFNVMMLGGKEEEERRREEEGGKEGRREGGKEGRREGGKEGKGSKNGRSSKKE